MVEFGADVPPEVMQKWVDQQVAELLAVCRSKTAKTAHPAGRARAAREVAGDPTEPRP